jgi:hypothetical protein
MKTKMYHQAMKLRPITFAVLFGLGTAAAGAAYAQGPAGHMGGERDKRFERIKDRCEDFEAKLANMDKKLTADQVRDIVAGRLAERGNPNIKVGKVTAKGDVVSVDIVTVKGDSLVMTREISTKTGLPPSATDRCDKIEERIEKAKADGKKEVRPHHRGPGPGFGFMMDRDGDRDLNLTADQVKKLAEARLILQGNPRLKVGAVKEKDKDTYSVDIVTVDNALVVTREVDKHSGRPSRD